MRALRPLRGTFGWCLVLLAFVVLSLGGCGEENTAIVVALTGDQSTPLPLRLTSLTGMRADYLVKAAMHFAVSPQQPSASAATQLVVHIVLRVGIPTTFESGRYELVWEGVRHAGRVTAPSLTFLGGQGGNPSIGGTFLLQSASGASAYRLTLPNTVLRRNSSGGRSHRRGGHAETFASRVVLGGVSQWMPAMGATGVRAATPLARHLATAKVATVG